MLLLYYAISSINLEFSLQVTPYQSHPGTVNLSQLLLSIHSLPDMEPYNSSNAIVTVDSEGLMDGIRENEGLKVSITDNEGSLGKDIERFLG